MKNVYTDSLEKNVIRKTDLKLLNEFIKLGDFKNARRLLAYSKKMKEREVVTSKN